MMDDIMTDTMTDRDARTMTPAMTLAPGGYFVPVDPMDDLQCDSCQ